ncbi:hypothetical protein C8R47DRAFT_947157, partial [Mycena vitilis]
WAMLWLEKAYLVFKDPRAQIFLKTLAACLGMEDMTGALNIALRWGIPFGLYIKTSEAREFMERNMMELERNTLSALYAPGYVDECLSYGSGGQAAYGRYVAIIGNLLNRPHAIAFVSGGGLLSF